MVFLDGTNIRTHQKAAGASRMGNLQKSETAVKRLADLVAATAPRPLVMADGAGRAIAFRLAPGRAHELPHAVPLLNRLPDVPKWVMADRGYTSHVFRRHIWDMGARPAIPRLATRRPSPVRTDPQRRNQVERLWARLREWRAAATHYEKTAVSFPGVFRLAAMLDRVRR